MRAAERSARGDEPVGGQGLVLGVHHKAMPALLHGLDAGVGAEVHAEVVGVAGQVVRDLMLGRVTLRIAGEGVARHAAVPGRREQGEAVVVVRP